MTRLARWILALSTAALLSAGCSNGDGGDRASASTTTSSPAATDATTTSSSVASSTTAGPSGASTTAPVGSTVPGAPTSSPAPATTQPGLQGAVATAGGWRMVISKPAPGSTIGAVAVLCYEVTGSIREATVAFDVTVLSPIGIGPFRAEAAVGRGTARVAIGPAPSGRYDIRIQLVVDGARVDGAVVTIPGVNVVSGGTQVATC